jgi:hypothetical protein
MVSTKSFAVSKSRAASSFEMAAADFEKANYGSRRRERNYGKEKQETKKVVGVVFFP